LSRYRSQTTRQAQFPGYEPLHSIDKLNKIDVDQDGDGKEKGEFVLREHDADGGTGGTVKFGSFLSHDRL
jgi:hypothetical protein